jgi:hypothetical protein
MKPSASFRILNESIVKILFTISLDYISGKSKPIRFQNVPDIGHTATSIDVFFIPTSATDVDRTTGSEMDTKILAGEFLNVIPVIIDHIITGLPEILRI